MTVTSFYVNSLIIKPSSGSFVNDLNHRSQKKIECATIS